MKCLWDDWQIIARFYELEDIIDVFDIGEGSARKFLKKYGFKLIHYYIEEKKLLEVLNTTDDLLEDKKESF